MYKKSMFLAQNQDEFKLNLKRLEGLAINDS